ncbi:ferric reduction oxidase 6-like [Tasmannia lanceolata]|uniref:ferric reduction oxidase 6-like n=1 Tax=Tasmannia lanceolata TaxID=3420 RepID=UPI0040641545
MAEHLAREPLLLNEGSEHGFVKQTSFSESLVKWVLKILMWAIFIGWVALIFFYPSEFIQGLFQKWILLTSGTVFGYSGSIFLLFSAPVLIIAFLSIAYVTAFPRAYHWKKKSNSPRFSLWTFPVLIDGPFGVVSAAELIGILLFAAYIIWAVYAYTMQNYSSISKSSLPFKVKSYQMLDMSGLRLGSIGLFCLAFLFLPVSRGSILLRVIDIPFEHATKYHIWLGHLTMMLFTLHGICYMVSWVLQGRLIQEMLEWRNIGIANLAGVISLAAGILMWVTSLRPVRIQYFELFFYTHQLYVVFILFLAMHVGDFIFSIAAGGIFLFLLDRFLRFCQSRTTINIIAATTFPCGSVELVFSKPKNLRYNALSFIFLQVRELSWLQWHPFSVSSSPLDGRRHLSVLIKVLGEWTRKLQDNLINIPEQPSKGLTSQPYSTITASVEGPYGHESAYHLMYENLILVAGGIGISPFFAILSDILHRVQERKPCLPKNVLIVWAVKRSKELSLLSVVDAESICPSFSDKLHLEIQTYVTQESEPLLEDGNHYKSMNCSSFPMTNGSSMSSLVGTGNNIWSGSYIIISSFGFVILFGLLRAFYIRPFGISSWWFQGLLFIICMTVSVIIFGGLVVFLWHLWEEKVSKHEISMDENERSGSPQRKSDACQTNLACLRTTQYGCRPNFQEIFDSIAKRWGHVDVGVIVCGPPSLQSSVAKECRSQSLKCRLNQPIFHFNSHSFDL